MYRAGAISAAELQEYFAKLLGRRSSTDELLRSIATILPKNQQQDLLAAAQQAADTADSSLNEWTPLNIDTASVDQGQLSKALQAAVRGDKGKSVSDRGDMMSHDFQKSQASDK